MAEIKLEPYPNEHSCRLKNPDLFKKDSFKRTKRKHDGKEYSVIMGKLKESETMTDQAYRYKKDIWGKDSAKKHCKDHNGTFEAASEEDNVKMEKLKANVVGFDADKQKLENDLEIINEKTREPLDIASIFILELEPTNDNVDSYFTAQGADTLQNMVDHINTEGVALLSSHKHFELPIGTVYKAWIEKDGETRHLKARAYILKDDEGVEVPTNSIIRRIKAGIINDISIGFYPGWWQCSICGKEMFEQSNCFSDREDWSGDCEHIPGEMYDGELCYAISRDGDIGEVSMVYDGACPEAIIEKVKKAFQRHLIPISTVNRLERQLKTNIIKKTRTKGKEKKRMADKLEFNFGEDIREKLDGVETNQEKLNILKNEFETLQKKADGLVKDAEIGKVVRERLIEDALKNAIAALGDEIEKDSYKRMLSGLPFKELEKVNKNLKVQKEKAFDKENRSTESEKPDKEDDHESGEEKEEEDNLEI